MVTAVVGAPVQTITAPLYRAEVHQAAHPAAGLEEAKHMPCPKFLLHIVQKPIPLQRKSLPLSINVWPPLVEMPCFGVVCLKMMLGGQKTNERA
jgi:hypothetical protein